MVLPVVRDVRPSLGCDPEFFIKQDGEVVGSETFLPKNGLRVDGDKGKIIIDGVQAELNPAPSFCRAILAENIRYCFADLEEQLTKKKGFALDFSRTVEIKKEKLMELGEDSRKFGCAPSRNIFQKLLSKSGVKINEVDPTEYRVRAAGGHIHIGQNSFDGYVDRALHKDKEKTIEMLDLLCGNTSVLIDRDEGNIERRKLYGRAGEYRTPKHGLEYRTLSNYWLTAYPLMSFAFGMARLAIQLMADPLHHKTYYTAFTSKVDQKKVHNAINLNDFDLAMENFKAIESLIGEVTLHNGTYPIHRNNMQDFHYFVKTVQGHGLKHWFPDSPANNWLGRSTKPCYYGFNDYLRNIVSQTPARKAATA